MNKWFRLDSPIMMGLSRMADMVFLSVLWFVCCLPVVTIGASTTAMYYVAMKVVRDEEDVSIASTFFQGFKNNFKQATVMNVISLVLGAIFLVDGYFWFFAQGTMAAISCAAFFAAFIWLICIMSYAYPLQAQFYNTVKQTFINAAILSMRKFITTVIVFVVNMLPVILSIASLLMFGQFNIMVQTLPVWILLYPGIAAYINARFFVKMFDPFLKAAQEQKEAPEQAEE